MMIGRNGLGLSAALRTRRVNSTPSMGDIWKSTMAMSAGHWRRASSPSAPSQHSRRCCTPTPASTVATIERMCWLSSTSSTRTADKGVVMRRRPAGTFRCRKVAPIPAEETPKHPNEMQPPSPSRKTGVTIRRGAAQAGAAAPTSSMGSRFRPRHFSRQHRCGPVARPSLPTAPIGSPRRTDCPRLTSTRERCR